MSLKDWLNCICTFEERRKTLFYGDNPNQSKFHQIVKEIAIGKKKISDGFPDGSSEYRRSNGGDSFPQFDASKHGEQVGGVEPGTTSSMAINNEVVDRQNSNLYESSGGIQEPPKEEVESKGSGVGLSSNSGNATKDEKVPDLRGGGRVPKLNNLKRVGSRTNPPGSLKKYNKK